MTAASPARRGNTRSAELSFERRVRADLVARRWLRVHVFFIGVTTFAVCWGLSALLLHVGVDSLAWRHATALVGSYGIYLGLMHLWARWMLSRDDGADALDVAAHVADALPSVGGRSPPTGVFRSGGGGDFGGGGAQGCWDGPLAEPGATAGSDAADAISTTVSAVADADEGVVVAVPLAIVVGVAVLLGSALGAAVFGLFGVDILLGVAVEIAFASAGGALALKAGREGWLLHVVRRTAWPMAAVLVATVLAGVAIEHWLPDAATLPQALRLLVATCMPTGMPM